MRSSGNSLAMKMYRIAALSTIAVFCFTSFSQAGPGGPSGGPPPAGHLVQKRVAPSKGLRVPHLPPGVETVLIAGITYFVFAGIYYQKSGSGYVVVEAPPPPKPAAAQGSSNTMLVIDADILNVRSGPGTQHRVVQQVRKGMQFGVLETVPGWRYIHVGGSIYGWVMNSYTHLLLPDVKG